MKGSGGLDILTWDRAIIENLVIYNYKPFIKQPCCLMKRCSRTQLGPVIQEDIFQTGFVINNDQIQYFRRELMNHGSVLTKDMQIPPSPRV